MLAGAQIALKRCGVLTMATAGADAVDSPDFAIGTGTGPDPTRPIIARTDTEALHVTVLTRSKSDSERASFWVRGPGMFSCMYGRVELLYLTIDANPLQSSKISLVLAVSSAHPEIFLLMIASTWRVCQRETRFSGGGDTTRCAWPADGRLGVLILESR